MGTIVASPLSCCVDEGWKVEQESGSTSKHGAMHRVWAGRNNGANKGTKTGRCNAATNIAIRYRASQNFINKQIA